MTDGSEHRAGVDLAGMLENPVPLQFQPKGVIVGRRQ